MPMWSTRSEASMNDVDITKRRLMMGRRGDARRDRLRLRLGRGLDRRLGGEVRDVAATLLAPLTLVVAIDPGKAVNRVWVSDGVRLVTE